MRDFKYASHHVEYALTHIHKLSQYAGSEFFRKRIEIRLFAFCNKIQSGIEHWIVSQKGCVLNIVFQLYVEIFSQMRRKQ